MITAPTIALEAARAGKIKAYAVTAKTPLSMAPDIPTVDEAGLSGLYTAPWYALWAPMGAPRGVVSKLYEAGVHALGEPAVRRRRGNLGVERPTRAEVPPEALVAFHKAEIDKWWALIKETGVRVQ